MSSERTASGARHGETSGVQDGNVIAEAGTGQERETASVGLFLRTVREEKGLTVAEVSKVLKLSFRQIESLESDDWESLPCSTIIRGFVRNYARMLEVDPAPLMVALDQLQMPQTPELKMTTGTPVNMQRDSRADSRDYFRVFAGAFVLILAILAYFFFPQDVWQSTLSALKTAAQSREVVEEKKPIVSETKVPEAAVEAPKTVALPVPVPEVPVPQAEPASVPAVPAAVSSTLKFSFAKPAWVEVRDRSGQVIFSQLSQAGSQRDIEGQAPFVLVIGNAAHVSLQYKGKAVDLSKRSKDDVARLTLE